MNNQTNTEVMSDLDGTLSLIEKMPGNLAEIIYARDIFSNGEIGRLAQTSKFMFFLCQESVKAAKEKTLLSYIVHGEKIKALAMIDADPALLFSYSETKDYSGRLYTYCTPFQLALLVQDLDLAKKIEPYFDNLGNGKFWRERQVNELFPEGLPQQEAYDFSMLVQTITNSTEEDIIAVLEKEQNDSPICQELNLFRAAITRLAMEEKFFNPLHLLEAYQIYDAQFENWSWKKRDLFWIQVVGYNQRFLPTYYAQAFCSGLNNIVNERLRVTRSLEFQTDEDESEAEEVFYPLRPDMEGLGYDFAAGMAPMLGAPGHEEGWDNLFFTFFTTNKRELLSLKNRVQDEEHARLLESPPLSAR